MKTLRAYWDGLTRGFDVWGDYLWGVSEEPEGISRMRARVEELATKKRGYLLRDKMMVAADMRRAVDKVMAQR